MEFSTSLGKYLIEYQDKQILISVCFEQTKLKNFLPIFSKRNIQKDIERHLSGFTLSHGFLAIIVGITHIPLLLELVEQKKKNGGLIWVFEQDIEIVEYLLKLYPVLLEHIVIIPTDDGVLLEQYISQVDLFSFKGYKVFHNSIIERAFPLFTKKLFFYFSQLMSERISDWLTRLEFEGRWVYNALCNILQRENLYPVCYLWENIDYGKSVILVSAGPSLRGCLPVLKRLQKHVFIVCVDAAYLILRKYGIIPNLVYTLDSQSFTIRHFLQASTLGDTSNIFLVADLVANPQITQIWDGPIFWATTASYPVSSREEGASRVVTPGCDFIENTLLPFLQGELNSLSEVSKKPILLGDIQSGGSVATSLFDLLRQMRFQKVILVGQDLAFTDYEVHSAGHYRADLWLSTDVSRFESVESKSYEMILARQVQNVEGIKGEEVVSDFIFSLYARWFEDAFLKVEVPIINTTKDGYLLKYCQYQTLAHLEQELLLDELPSFVLDTKKAIQYNVDRLNRVRDYILYTEYKSSLVDEFPFLEYIGRKFLLKEVRDKLKKTADAKSSLHLSSLEKHREFFWNKLRRALS